MFAVHEELESLPRFMVFMAIATVHEFDTQNQRITCRAEESLAKHCLVLSRKFFESLPSYPRVQISYTDMGLVLMVRPNHQ